MINLWTWGGKYFGYRDDNELWTCLGRHVGRFHDEEIYSPIGIYLGELKNDNRLITNKSKALYRKSSFAPYGLRASVATLANYVGYVMYAGHEDFPIATSFK